LVRLRSYRGGQMDKVQKGRLKEGRQEIELRERN